ncbi:hypothetical protein JCM14202_310 [Agrilactobacillus composti DSM 18527 = JCM 14202]|nr:hypothetical protein [Agrilactobacillus composti]GAF38498.1 hypothetical protein JCM14202_310 [Agrilactobacillus composti DSM 18527 = JCM 14202]
MTYWQALKRGMRYLIFPRHDAKQVPDFLATSIAKRAYVIIGMIMTFVAGFVPFVKHWSVQIIVLWFIGLLLFLTMVLSPIYVSVLYWLTRWTAKKSPQSTMTPH